MAKTQLFRKPWALISAALIAFVPFLSAQPANAVTSFTVTVVASGGAAENSTWTYASGQITPSASVSINASDLVAKLNTGPLVVYSGRILVNTSVSHSTANTLTFKSTGNIIVGGGLTLQSQGGDIVFHSDSDANNTGHVRLGWDANCALGTIATNGGDIIVGGGANPATGNTAAQNNDQAATGCPGGTPPLAGVGVYNYMLNAAGGDISVRGGSPNLGSSLSVRSVNIGSTGGATTTFQTTGAGSIYIYGDGSLIGHNNAWGIATGAFNATTDSGSITLESRGNASGPTNARGMSIGGAANITSASGDISIIDRTDGALAGYAGINLGAAISVTTNGDFVVQADEITQGGALTLDVDSAFIGSNTTASFTAVYSTGVINAANSNSLSIGSPGNTSAITLGGAITSGGPIGVNAATVTVNAAVTATGSPITFTTTGGVTQNATITASTFNLAGTATYNPQSFTVAGGSAQTVFTATFDSQGGSAVSSVTFASGSPITLPTPPTLSGHEFSGWSQTAAGSVLADSFTPGAANLTLFAKWLPLSLKTSLASWTPATVTLGQAVRVTLFGSNLDAVQSVTSSTGTARIVTKNGDRLEVEITSAALGNGSIQISSPTLVASLGGVFAVVAADSVKLSTFSTRALFSTNSSVLTAQAKRQLIASLKKISDPASIVITGSVAAQRPTAANRALALKRAQAVAAVVAQVFSNVEPKLLVLAPRGTAPLNNNAVVSIQAPATRN